MIDNMLVYFSFYISLFVDTSNLTFKDSHKRYLICFGLVYNLFGLAVVINVHREYLRWIYYYLFLLYQLHRSY